MNTFSKILAGIAVAAALLTAYVRLGANLQVALVATNVQSASELPDEFEAARTAVKRGEASIALFADDLPGDAGDYQFVTLRYKVQNFGMLPAEWLEIRVSPEVGDMLQTLSDPADVSALSTVYLDARILVRADADLSQGRYARLSYYVLGQPRLASGR